MEPTNPTEPVLTPQPSAEPVVLATKTNWLVSILFLIIGILIGAGGLWAYQNYLAKGPTSSPSPTPTATPDLTANWKTYSNNYWKLSFKYPDNLLKPCPNYFTEKEGIAFWEPNFTCTEGHDILPKIGLYGYDVGKYAEAKEPYKTETVILDGKQGQKKTYIYDESDGPLFSLKQSVNIVFNVPNGTIVLSQLGDNPSEQKLFDQILSTFKFTNQTVDTSNWKTFINTKYGYQFKYPTNYSVGQNGQSSEHPEISDAVVALNLSAKEAPDEPRFSVSIMDLNNQSLEQKAMEHFNKWGNYSIVTTYPAENNHVVSNFTKTNLNGKEAFMYTISGSYYDDGASEGISASRERQYVWVQNDAIAFLIRSDNVNPTDQILSTFKFTD